MCKVVSYAFMCVLFALISQIAIGADPSLIPADLDETLDLYLSADSSYVSGDLITASQLKEFQVYLRRTRGPSLATHQKWTKRTLADRAYLANLFHNGGATLIRSAVKGQVTYSQLNKLARTPRGRAVIEKAIEANDPEHIFAAIAVNKPKEPSDSPADAKNTVRQPVDSRIYTADDYVQAVRKAAAPKSSDKAASESPSVVETTTNQVPER